jgi:cell division protein FtsQ
MRLFSGSKSKTPANRVEQSRQKRSARTQERVSSVTNRVINQARNRQVISRGKLFGSPIHQQAATRRSRRTFYLTMDQRGSELRLPTLPVFHPGWRLISGLIAVAALAGLVSMFISPFFQVGSVNIQGLQRISPDEIAAELNLENRSIIEIDRNEILEKVSSKYPELIDIKVNVEMPNIITMSAVERQPVLAWRRGEQILWVDADGFIFPARGEAGSLVIVDGQISLPLEPLSVEELVAESEASAASAAADTANADSADAASAAAESAGEAADPASAALAGLPSNPKANLALLAAALELSQKLDPGTQLLYTEVNGLGWVNQQGWKVYIGKDLNQFDEKFALYQTIASHLADQGIQPTLVSVEQMNAPYYRLEQ